MGCFDDTIRFNKPKICDPIEEGDLEDPVVDFRGGCDPMDLDDGCNDTPLPIVPPLPNGIMSTCGGNFDPDETNVSDDDDDDLPQITVPPYTPYMSVLDDSSDEMEMEGGGNLNPDEIPYIRDPDDDAPVGDLEPDVPDIRIIGSCHDIGSLEPDTPVAPTDYEEYS